MFPQLKLIHFFRSTIQFCLGFPLGTEPLQLTLTSPVSPTCLQSTCHLRKPWHFCAALNEGNCWFQHNYGQQKLYGYLQGEQKPKPESNQKLAPFWTNKNFHFTKRVEGRISCPSYLLVPELKLNPCSSEHTKGIKNYQHQQIHLRENK